MPQGCSLAIGRLCRRANVSRAGYYRFWRTSAPRAHDTTVRDAIQRLALANGRHRGYRTITIVKYILTLVILRCILGRRARRDACSMSRKKIVCLDFMSVWPTMYRVSASTRMGPFASRLLKTKPYPPRIDRGCRCRRWKAIPDRACIRQDDGGNSPQAFRESGIRTFLYCRRRAIIFHGRISRCQIDHIRPSPGPMSLRGCGHPIGNRRLQN